MPRGGARANAGRDPKPPLTPDELAVVQQIRAKGQRKHGSSWTAAAQAVSAGRIGSAIDPRTIAERSVSAPWVKQQVANAEGISLQNNSNGVGEGPLRNQSGGASHTGPRAGCESPPGAGL